MLTESFVVSTRNLEKQAQATAVKDVGIHLHHYQPIPSLKTSFKKSSTRPNCLAVSATHIFAAQADKSVIHVYSRERGNQEAVVPFQEKITCLVHAGRYDGAGTLVLGTQGGRLILWEPSPNDTIQPPPFSPLRTLTNHRAAINAVLFGHSGSKANFAISAANDQTCIIWDYINGTVLHTYLLSNNPHCLALDPADRAAYAGFEDGSIQILDFYKKNSVFHPLHDADQRSAPTQPTPSDRWHLHSDIVSPAYCLQVSYDGTALLSGHENGKVQCWNPATRGFNNQIADLTLPVTNLLMLPPTGFPNPQTPYLKLHNVVKPRYESSFNAGNGMSNNGTSTIPINYTITAQFLSTLPLPASAGISDLDTALTHPSFPTSMLEEGIAELASLNNFTSSDPDEPSELDTLRTQNADLKVQLDDALRRQRDAIAEVLQFDRERVRRGEEESLKRARKKSRRIRRSEMEERRRKVVMGELVGDGAKEAEGATEDEGLSSDTDEMSTD
ncbi:MAG: hypothetical protein Q9186_003206 [Xanthomendoza sp. 1 TL-2023]